MADVTPYGFQAPPSTQPVTWKQPVPETDGPLHASTDLEALGVLFARGRRAGWMAYDPRFQRSVFSESAPEPTPTTGTRANRYDQALAVLRGRRELARNAAVYGLVAGVILATAQAAQSTEAATAAQARGALVAVAVGVGLAWWARGRFTGSRWLIAMVVFAAAVAVISDLISFKHGTGALPILRIAVFGLAFAALAATGWWSGLLIAHALVRKGLDRTQQRSHHQALEQWRARKLAFERQQDAWIEQVRLFQWGPADVPERCQRIDIFGGSPSSWESFTTIFAASLLGSGVPVTILDLSRRPAIEELVRVASARGIGIDIQALPQNAADSDLLRGMDRQQLVAALVEAIYGNQAEPQRGSRLADGEFLNEVCSVLEGPDGDGCVSLARIALGLGAAMGEPAREADLVDDRAAGPAALTQQEHDILATETFGHDNRTDGMSRLRELKAAAATLGALRLAPAARSVAPLRIVQAQAGRGARAEFIKELVVAAQTCLIESDPVPVGALIVAGADRLGAEHLEYLATVCADARVPLVQMFEHLRDDARKIVGGGGLVGLMRMGNDQEANAAADFIGRQYRMVFSSHTWEAGQSRSHGVDVGQSGSTSQSETHGEDRSVTGQPVGSFERKRPGALFTDRTYSSGTSTSRQTGSDQGWSRSESDTNSTNTSQSDSVQRVHEHIVAPETLQQMPDCAMLLIDHVGGKRRIRPVETDPRIATLPGVSTDPLPEQPVYQYTPAPFPPPQAALAAVPQPVPAAAAAPGPQTPALEESPMPLVEQNPPAAGPHHVYWPTAPDPRQGQ